MDRLEFTVFSNRAFLVLGISILSSSCIGPNVDNGAFYGDGTEIAKGENLASNHREEILNLLDTKRYNEVIRYFGVHPEIASNPSYRVYLGQAYIGAGGFEIGTVAAKVTGFQSEINPLGASCPSEALKRVGDTTPAHCLIGRVLLASPDPDNESLLKGQSIFSELFPQGRNIPKEYRVYLSSVYLTSTLNRAAGLIERIPSDGQLSDSELIELISATSNIVSDAKSTWYYLGSAGPELTRRIWNSASKSDEVIRATSRLRTLVDPYPNVRSFLKSAVEGNAQISDRDALEREVRELIAKIQAEIAK